MKSVLISIRPKWCELIASGKKTIEVRKTRPKIDTPFKCYIYQTRKTWVYSIYQRIADAQGKVIGEFVCDEILDYEAEFVDDSCQNSICKFEVDEEGGERIYCFETSNEVDNPDDCKLCKNSCLSFNKIKQYISKGKEGFFDFYGWHISDLVIYNKPKELSEFYTECCPYLHNKTCYNNELCAYREYNEHGDIRPCVKEVKRSPQSWCYVEGNVV